MPFKAKQPEAQMTLVLLEKGLVLEGSTPKIEDKQVPGIYNIFPNRSFCSDLVYPRDTGSPKLRNGFHGTLSYKKLFGGDWTPQSLSIRPQISPYGKS